MKPVYWERNEPEVSGNDVADAAMDARHKSREEGVWCPSCGRLVIPDEEWSCPHCGHNPATAKLLEKLGIKQPPPGAGG